MKFIKMTDPSPVVGCYRTSVCIRALDLQLYGNKHFQFKLRKFPIIVVVRLRSCYIQHYIKWTSNVENLIFIEHKQYSWCLIWIM